MKPTLHSAAPIDCHADDRRHDGQSGKEEPARGTHQRSPLQHRQIQDGRARVSGNSAEPGEIEPPGKLARAEHQLVQFKDTKTNKFVAVAVDGDVKVYG